MMIRFFLFEGMTSLLLLLLFYHAALCTKFCDDYFATCVTTNLFVNPEPTKDKYHRNLVTTNEAPVPRKDNLGSLSEDVRECQSQCMLWPRGQDPATYPAPRGAGRDATEEEKSGVFNSNLGGDTFWCRKKHLVSYLFQYS